MLTNRLKDREIDGWTDGWKDKNYIPSDILRMPGIQLHVLQLQKTVLCNNSAKRYFLFQNYPIVLNPSYKIDLLFQNYSKF